MRKEIWKDNYRVHSYEVDLKSHLSFINLLQYLQESAWNHAENLEVGYTHLLKKNFVWILSKMRITSFIQPKWGEVITVYTFPSGYDKLFCYRDFEVFNNKNDRIAIGTTTWFVIDKDSRRPQRTDTYFDGNIKSQESVYEKKVGKISGLEQPVVAGNNLVTFKDVDVNGHLNNVRYVEWILDGFDFDFRKDHLLKDVEINFLNEAVIHDEVEINTQQVNELSYLHNLIRKSNGKELCRVKTVWQ